MRTEPPFNHDQIHEILSDDFGITISSLEFLPLGFDTAAAVYRAHDLAGSDWFVKVRHGEMDQTGIALAVALHESGIPNILAPIRSRSGSLATVFGPISVVVFPYRDGVAACTDGLNRQQWVAFGETLRAVHDAVLEPASTENLPKERFALPSAKALREHSAATHPSSPWTAYANLIALHRNEINTMLDRTELLAKTLGDREFDLVPCHADIHAANILVEPNGQIWLVDWDAPSLASRERDLLFVVGSRIASDVLPHEETWFFEGYGRVTIDPDALIYFRYERVIEDLAEFGNQLSTASDLEDPDVKMALHYMRAYFEPGGMLDGIEHVSLPPGVERR